MTHPTTYQHESLTAFLEREERDHEDFIALLVDCKGYSREDAEELADEYDNDVDSYIRDIGGDAISIREAHAYLGRRV